VYGGHLLRLVVWLVSFKHAKYVGPVSRVPCRRYDVVVLLLQKNPSHTHYIRS